MVEDDVQLIRRTLSGDDTAFSALVQKYQKGVHALAWRKVGDFHYAEEITQDTFLQVYKKLSTLKNPNQFAGWLYVIANRRCLNWIQRHKPAMPSLETTSTREIEELSHTHYVSERRESEAVEHRQAIVKELLEKLPESERTVVTLYYLGEMVPREIGDFLGVSVNTIKSRLRRARERLQNEEELLIQEELGIVQLSPNLTDNIMQQVTDIKLTPPPVGKPFLPWAAVGTAAVLVLLLLGASDQYLVRFQKPYSFKATSEPTIEIVDTAVILDTDSEPDVRNQPGRAGATDKGNDAGLRTSETLLTSEAQGDSPLLSTPRRIQPIGPQGSHVFDIFATSKGTLYAATQTGIHRLTTEATAWTLVNTNVPIPESRMSMAEHAGSLYIVSTDKIFASRDDGRTWNAFCPRPEGHVVGLIITDDVKGTDSQASITMYLALRDKGVFRSTDMGAQWNPFNEGLTGKHIYIVTKIGNTVFTGTNEGLYRLNSGVWEQVQENTFKTN